VDSVVSILVTIGGKGIRRSCLAALAAALLASPQAVAGAVVNLPDAFPAAGELTQHQAAIRAAPDSGAKRLRTMRQFRPDLQIQVVLALGARQDGDGLWWYKLSLPGRPNGQRGWVRASLVDIRPVRNRIVVYRGSRRLEVRRVRDGKLLLRGVVAVGKPGAETPLGRNFYVRSRFVPIDGFFGAFALETSAYSRLSDWPGGGVAGIHGTNRPELLGRAVSHGCVRVHNSVAIRLRRLAPLGTPIDILP
jgi:lipoprotein-anchoring transpeptidase ErfK/SrfK